MPRSRPIAADLVRLFSASDAPIYLVDDQRQIVYCNPACVAWLGVEAEDLLGQQCVYQSNPDVGRIEVLAAALCPPPQTFCGKPQTARVTITTEVGQTISRRGQFWPLGDGQDESAPVIALLEQSDASARDLESDMPAEDFAARLHDALRTFRQQAAGRFRVDGLIGTSHAITRARAQVELAANSAASVLIRGPAGAGKRHVAKAIHYGQRQPGALVSLECGLLESNALRATLRSLSRRAADQPGGTLLLVDVEQLTADAQAELAGMLRERALPMRIVSISAKALAELPPEAFSPELASALATLTIELPPLARRVDDLPLLAQAFLEAENSVGTKQVGGFATEAFERLAAYPWPGNLDELASIVRQAHQQASGGEVAARDLPREIHLALDGAAHPKRSDETIVLEEYLGRVEKELIVRAMRRAKGNKSKAAKLLGLTRPRLYRRLVQLGLQAPDEPGGE